MVDAINPVNYFKDPTTEISKDFDFNGDGTVDVADYNLACVYLNDDDPSNDVKFTQEQLDNTFAALIEADKKVQTFDEITDDNAEEVAKKVIDAINSKENVPANAKTLNQLQEIGRNLTKYIKECADLAKVLADKITVQKKELDELAEKRAEKEAAYADKSEEIEAKEKELDSAMHSVLQESNHMSSEYEEECDAVVKQCIKDYANGKFPGQDLKDIIKTQLAGVGFDVSALRSALDNCSSIGNIISSLCSDISNIASDIRDISMDYNTKNAQYNSLVNTRNDVLTAAQTASTNYQTGYQRRLDMRKELVDKYYVESKGDYTKSTNTQVQKLAEFLNNKELDNMPFADAWNVLKEAFGGVLKFGDNYKITIPKGHDAAGKNIFQALAQSLKDNYGINADWEKEADPEDPGYVDPDTPEDGTPVVTWTDPISFTDGNVKYDFIKDKNNDGIFNDASEFLGAENGWAEMKQYDTNGDGVINGEELKKLQLVAVDQESGQFSFKNADEAGIASIDLASFKETEGKKLTMTNDYNEGTFKINMKNGSVLQGVETQDSNQNLNNKYGVLFGASTETSGEMYEENPFMDDFKETVNTDDVIATAKVNIENTEAESDSTVSSSKMAVKHNVNTSASKAESEKQINDEIEAKKQKKAEAAELAKKEEAEKLAKKEEEKEAEAKKTGSAKA